jgi:hypothetical protein
MLCMVPACVWEAGESSLQQKTANWQLLKRVAVYVTANTMQMQHSHGYKGALAAMAYHSRFIDMSDPHWHAACTCTVVLRGILLQLSLLFAGLTAWCLPVVPLQLAHWKVHKKQCKQLQHEKEAAAAANAAER